MSYDCYHTGRPRCREIHCEDRDPCRRHHHHWPSPTPERDEDRAGALPAPVENAAAPGPAFAYAWQECPRPAVTAGGPLPLSNFTATGEGVFSLSGSSVAVNQPGTYALNYSFAVPANTAVATTLTPQLNGAAIPGASVTVESAADGGSTVYTGQGVFTVNAVPAAISLISTAALAITACGADTAANTVSLTKLA